MKNIKYACLVLSLVIAGYVYADPENTVDFSDRTDVTLENGLRVILLEHHEQPTISFRLVVNAGSIDDPLNKRGLAGLTGQLLRTGTSSRTQEQIIENIALIGSTIAVSTKSHYTSVSLDILKRYSDIGFDVFTDIILDPVFPPEEIKHIRKEHINYTKVLFTDNHRIAVNHGNFLLFGSEHPVGRIITEKSLKSINRKNIIEFYQNFFHPNNSILLVVGDFAQEDMLKKVKDKFSKWQKSDLAKRIETKKDFSKSGNFTVVDKPKMTQALIHLNQWAIESHRDDYFAYQLMNYILGGGGFSSRLMDAVRAKGGKTYAIWSRYNAHPDYGVLSLTTSTRNDQLENTHELIRSVLKKLVDEGITPEELSRAKAYKTGAIPLNMESPSMIANKMINAISKGYTIDDLSKEIDYYNRVTVEDVNRTVREYLLPEKMNIVIVADEKKIREQLKKIGNYEKVYYKKPLN